MKDSSKQPRHKKPQVAYLPTKKQKLKMPKKPDWIAIAKKMVK